MEPGRPHDAHGHGLSYDRLLGRPLPRLLVLAALWTFLGLIFSSARYVDDLSLGRDTSVADALAFGLVNWYTFALLSFPVLWLTRRFPLIRGKALWSRLPAYFGGSAVFSLVHTVISHVLWFERAGFPFLFRDAFRYHLASHYHFNLLIFIAIIGYDGVTRHYRIAAARELERARLETLLAETRLEALRAQLQPHFLFNSLNAVAALIHDSPDEAYEMLAGVAELLRLALAGASRQLVTLQEEASFIGRYAALHQARFGDRLTFELAVEEQALPALVPSLILQPLVENAIVHGVTPHDGGGSVWVSGVVADGRLRLRVADSGPGIAWDQGFEEGIGLSNCRERLRRLYGDDQRLELRSAPEGGLSVELEIPLRLDTQEGGDG